MTAITVKGPLAIAGTPLRCPGRGAGSVPRQLTLMATGQQVMATCGEKHRGEGRLGRRAQCFFPAEGITPATLAVLARGKPGRFKLTLPDGGRIEGTLAEPAKGGTATGKAAAAIAAKTGKPGAPAPAKPAGRATGGSLTAAMNAVAAIAGAAGQTAAAVGSAAGAVGKVADLGREGMRTGQAAIKAADNVHARRFAARNTTPGDAS